MNKAGGIIAIVAGVFGVIAASVTLGVGGLGSAFKADHADTVVALGWGGVCFSFLAIILGAVAFYRPKGADIGLILCSLAGMVLGGTIVAIFMALSLAGGLLCLIGKRKQVESSSPKMTGPEGYEVYVSIPDELEKLANLRDGGVLSDEEFRDQKALLLSHTPTESSLEDDEHPSMVTTEGHMIREDQPRSRTRTWALAGAGMFGALVIGVILASSFNKGQASTPSPRNSDPPVVAVANTQRANISPEGELAEAFKLGSNYTDLQRENLIKSLRGKVVAWTLPVYEVERNGDGYKVQTKSGRAVGTFIYLSVANADEQAYVENLKTGDTITVKGRVADVFLRNLVVKEAVLNNLAQASNSTPPSPAKIESAGQLVGDGFQSYEACMSEGSAEDKIFCAAEEFKREDLRLNREYQRVMAQYRSSGQSNKITELKAVEVAWLKRMGQECPEVDSTGDPGWKTERAAMFQCRLKATKERADKLAALP